MRWESIRWLDHDEKPEYDNENEEEDYKSEAQKLSR